MGTLVEPSLLPCVGLGAYDTDTAGTLSTELQLYADAAQSWAIVQQRSAPAVGRHACGGPVLYARVNYLATVIRPGGCS